MKKLILLLSTCMAICANAGTNYIAGSLQVATNLSVRAQISTRTVVATNVTFQSVTPANYVLPPVNGITLFNSNGLFYSIRNLAGVYTTNGFGNTDYIAGDDTVSNVLSTRLIATNAALLTAIGNVSGTAGALTNNETRNVVLDGGLKVGNSQSLLAQFVIITNILSVNGVANISNMFSMSYTGNGTGITNIHGSNSIAINTISTNNIDPTFYNLVTNIGAGSGTAYIAADTTVSNGLSARIIATNTALVTAYGSADTVVSNGLSARIIATNTALVTAYGSADTTVSNGAITTIVAATNNLIITTNKIDATFYNLLTNTGVSSGGYQTGNSTDATNVNLTVTGNLIASNQTNTTLSVSNAYFSYTNIAAGFDGDGKLIGTNAYIAADTTVSNGVVAAYGSADTTVSNGLSARIIATNAALVTAYGSADTTVSNGLSARIIATNTALVTAYGSADTTVSNGLVTLIVAATNGFTTTTYVNNATNNLIITTNKIDATFYNLVTNIGSGSGTAGALTNNETRAVTLNSDLTVLGNLVAANQTNTTLSVSNAYFSYTNIAAGFDGDGKLIGTNAYIAADTTLSNALVTRIDATNTAIEGKGVGYTITLAGGWESGTLADATTYYIGGDLFNSTRAGFAAYTNWSVEIPKAGTIKRVYLKVRLATAGTTENVTNHIRLNDSSDVGLIDLSYNKIMVEGNNTSVSQSVVAGDKVALKIACPTWVTNPIGVRWYCILYIY